MATRTTVTAVREIIDTALKTAQVRAFILDANVWVSEELATVDPAISPARLEIIERYLACALIRVRDLGLKSATLQDVTEQYQVDASVTDYLLRAASFDPTGKIRAEFLTSNSSKGGSAASKTVLFQVGQGFADCDAD